MEMKTQRVLEKDRASLEIEAVARGHGVALLIYREGERDGAGEKHHLRLSIDEARSLYYGLREAIQEAERAAPDLFREPLETDNDLLETEAEGDEEEGGE